MSDRKSCLISPTVGGFLVSQIAHELKNFNLYKSFANFFSVEGIEDLEKYYNKRAAEEMLHHDWINTYLSNADYKYEHPEVEVNIEKIKTYIDPFEATIVREILTTDLIYNIYNVAQEEKDYMTCSWLYKKLIKEQIEEENTSRMAYSIMNQDGSIFTRAKRILELLN